MTQDHSYAKLQLYVLPTSPHHFLPSKTYSTESINKHLGKIVRDFSLNGSMQYVLLMLINNASNGHACMLTPDL
jgi:hypothetical protein